MFFMNYLCCVNICTIMTLQQLEYVIAIDKYRHFVRAADSCGVTQSTLSSMLRKLEEELDLTLFDRDTHPIQPTLAGEKIIKQAKIVIFHAKQLQEMSLTERKIVSGNVKLGITPTIAPYIMPKLFKYINEIPEVTLNAMELQRGKLTEMLKNADIDMAIMSLPCDMEDLLEIPLYDEKIWAYVSPKDPLYKQTEIDFNTMPRERLWALKHEICFQQQIAGLADCESERSSIYESGTVPTLLRIVDENEGFTVIPELHIPILRESSKKNLRPLINSTPVRRVSIFIRKDYVRESLLNVIVDAIKKIIPEEMQDERLRKFQIRI